MLPLTIVVPVATALLAATFTQPPRREVARATVALVASLPDPSARALVILRAGPGQDVVLLLQNQAQVADLAAALTLLDRTRRNEGAPAVRDRQVVLKNARIERPLNDNLQRRLQAHLRRLHSAAERDVAGVGRVRAIDIRVSGSGPVS